MKVMPIVGNEIALVKGRSVTMVSDARPQEPKKPDSRKPEGCELCGDWPVVLTAECHPTAPLRLEMPDDHTIVAYCYLPECGREVARFTLKQEETS